MIITVGYANAQLTFNDQTAQNLGLASELAYFKLTAESNFREYMDACGKALEVCKDDACKKTIQTAITIEKQLYLGLQRDYSVFIFQLSSDLMLKKKPKMYKVIDRSVAAGRFTGKDDKAKALYDEISIIRTDVKNLHDNPFPTTNNKALTDFLPTVKDLFDIYASIREAQATKADSLVALLKDLQLSSIDDLLSGQKKDGAQ